MAICVMPLCVMLFCVMTIFVMPFTLWLLALCLFASYNTIQYILNWPLPIGAFQGQWNTTKRRTEQRQLLRIPTGRRQTSWLFTSAAGKLNQGQPGTNSTSGQSWSWTRDLRISKQAPKPLRGHTASCLFPWWLFAESARCHSDMDWGIQDFDNFISVLNFVIDIPPYSFTRNP